MVHSPAYFLLFFYSLLCVIFAIVWMVKSTQEKVVTKAFLPFSILVPVRNEEDNIIRLVQSILTQNYPKDKYELIIIDDYSEDNTRVLAENILINSSIDFRIFSNDKSIGSPKKRAISKAIKLTKYEHIICTDGDCEVPINWLQSFNVIYEQGAVQFISGPVTFFDEKDNSVLRILWNKLQIIEFASLVGSGAAAIWANKPNMCSGANISYTKSAFFAVDGYQGNEEIASGDDEFLMHKIAHKFPDKILFNTNSESIVLTNDQASLKNFYQQRKRWASKWSHYQSFAPKILAAFIFLINAITIWAIFVSDWNILVGRWLAELLFLIPILIFMKKVKTAWLIPALQVIYPFYVLIFGLASLKKDTYNWKGRKLK